jgi:hypothetical protein
MILKGSLWDKKQKILTLNNPLSSLWNQKSSHSLLGLHEHFSTFTRRMIPLDARSKLRISRDFRENSQGSEYRSSAYPVTRLSLILISLRNVTSVYRSSVIPMVHSIRNSGWSARRKTMGKRLSGLYDRPFSLTHREISWENGGMWKRRDMQKEYCERCKKVKRYYKYSEIICMVILIIPVPLSRSEMEKW